MNTAANTIEALLRMGQQQLAATESPALEAGILLAYVLEKDRSYLMAWPQRQATPAQQERYLALLTRRTRGEPIAYITGEREFWSLPLSVNAHVLIPRPETEHLVQAALDRIPLQAQWQLADLGTGSGAIALAIASERPRCQVYASDRSAEALTVAKHNAKKLKLSNVEFHHGDWFAALPAGLRLNMIISNPPYVASNDPHLQQGDLRFEPSGALAAGIDGLDDIRLLVQQAPKYLQAGGWLLLEHGYDQGEAVTGLFRKNGFQEVCCLRDYGQRERATLGQKP